MISNTLSAIEGVSIYAVIGLLLFFALFISMIVWTFKKDRSYIAKMESLPLDNESDINNHSESDYEVK
ncbi:MAG: cbb3-type cytochrome c oxidase subunit 3 [Bacteroidetes bacterium]|nr:cbb3-type cytochrome c oxidase subunit 3 [Bacteroidota bacterium]MBU1680240.1 cbb3-type cytochrome c oxidase subunit 3 [Bacteroidota bacterium]MBU2508453.1 cbb3-type cytochrome c oxidase subunit 3 [Bacteroidota bacterium]